jgi:hypothetical protein
MGNTGGGAVKVFTGSYSDVNVAPLLPLGTKLGVPAAGSPWWYIGMGKPGGGFMYMME